MLLPYSARLRQNNVRIVLASMSPRRQELMRMLLPDEQTSSTTATAAVSTPAAAASSSASSSSSTDGRVPFRCVPSTFAEDLPHSAHATAASYACATSLAKAREVWSRVKNETDVLIAADTVVVRDGTILEKPADADAAFEMLSSLNNRTHQVVTGCTLLFHADPAFGSVTNSSLDSAEPLVVSFSVSTDVTFADIPSSALRLYVSSGEPFDKAGGYGYQSLAATFVREIRGCYYNVVGFPLYELVNKLAPRMEEILKKREEAGHADAAAAAKQA